MHDMRLGLGLHLVPCGARLVFESFLSDRKAVTNFLLLGPPEKLTLWEAEQRLGAFVFLF